MFSVARWFLLHYQGTEGTEGTFQYRYSIKRWLIASIPNIFFEVVSRDETRFVAPAYIAATDQAYPQVRRQQ
ncbi:MAG: hypothetical protein D6716_02060 [Chloroflexi bacterium]|nr:MAG: hypothetical protein D6716_02060 [Chloroflexota bacterium]